MPRAKKSLIETNANLSPEVLEDKRQVIIAKAVDMAEEVLESLFEEARGGNVAAAKLLLQVAGLIHSGGSMVATQVNVPQITISPEELEELERDLYGRRIDDD